MKVSGNTTFAPLNSQKGTICARVQALLLRSAQIQRDIPKAVLDLSAYENAPLLMDALQLLVQKSFVRQVAEARFDLLVSVKEYASEHLRTDGRYQGSGPAALSEAEVRHGAYFAGLDEKAATADRGAELASLVRDTSGLRGEPIALVEWVAGSALEACGKEHEAYPHFEASLASARDAGDRRGECRALVSLGAEDKLAGRTDSARVHFDAALVAAREMGDRVLQSYAYKGLGNLDYALGRVREARVHYEASLSLAREAGDRSFEGDVLGNLSYLYEEEGNMDEFRSYGEAALAVARELGYRRLEGVTLCNLGLGNQVQGRLDEALGQLVAALAVARDLGHVELECIVLCNLGMVFESMASLRRGAQWSERRRGVAACCF